MAAVRSRLAASEICRSPALTRPPPSRHLGPGSLLLLKVRGYMHHCTANPPSCPTPQSSTPVLVPVLQNWRGPAPPIEQLPFFFRSQTRSVLFFSDKPNEVDTSSRKRLLTGHSQSVADIDLNHHPNPPHPRRLPLGRSPSDRLGRIDPTTAAGSRSQNRPRPTRPNASGVSLFSSPVDLRTLQVGTLFVTSATAPATCLFGSRPRIARAQLVAGILPS